MKIEIGGYIITSDSKNVMLNKKSVIKAGENAGQETQTTVGYYTDLTHCLQGLVDQAVRESSATSVKELLTEIRALKQEIADKLGGI